MSHQHQYRSTESKYKGGAKECYITYDIDQKTRSGDKARVPKVKRFYASGDITDTTVGHFTKRSGRRVFGVRIDQERTRKSYRRQGYTARRGNTEYRVKESRVPAARQHFTKYIELPETAHNVTVRTGNLPERYRSARQSVT